MSQRDFGWCFIGAGGITERVMNDFPHAQGSYPAAVWSRNFENAKKFAQAHGAKAYEEAAGAICDPDVKAVYIATPHPWHKEYSLLALRHKKPVLCEKPVTMNSAEALEIMEEAKKSGVYFAEGMWTRHNPCIKKILEWIKEGRIGKVRSLNAAFSFAAPPDPAGRLLNPALGGGALLDVGVYVIALSQFIFGGAKPDSILASAVNASTGVDGAVAMTLAYGDAIARLYCGVIASEPDCAIISGEEGYIYVPKFWAPRAASLNSKSLTEKFAPEFEGEGFQFEFDAIRNDILAGKTENEFLTREYSLRVMKIIDEVFTLIKR